MNRKRAGYGHHTDKEPRQGDLALFCPACPQPGINLPPEWKSKYDRYVLYFMHSIVKQID